MDRLIEKVGRLPDRAAGRKGRQIDRGGNVAKVPLNQILDALQEAEGGAGEGTVVEAGGAMGDGDLAFVPGIATVGETEGGEGVADEEETLGVRLEQDLEHGAIDVLTVGDEAAHDLGMDDRRAE